MLLNTILGLWLCSLVVASPTPVMGRNKDSPTPTLPFTLAAFQSPGGNTISGIHISARYGTLWADPSSALPRTSCGSHHNHCPPGNETVFFVDRYGQAWLDSDQPQQVYLNARTGAIEYLNQNNTDFEAGAVTSGFLHLGEGTQLSVAANANYPQYQNAGPGSFQFLGGINGYSYWMLCPRPGPGYQVMLLVGGKENWNACVGGVNLVALDYSGVSPAAGVYL